MTTASVCRAHLALHGAAGPAERVVDEVLQLVGQHLHLPVEVRMLEQQDEVAVGHVQAAVFLAPGAQLASARYTQPEPVVDREVQQAAPHVARREPDEQPAQQVDLARRHVSPCERADVEGSGERPEEGHRGRRGG